MSSSMKSDSSATGGKDGCMEIEGDSSVITGSGVDELLFSHEASMKHIHNARITNTIFIFTFFGLILTICIFYLYEL